MKLIRSLRRGTATALVTALLLSGMAVALSACNTTAGVGQDVSATGNALSNTATKAKQGL